MIHISVYENALSRHPIARDDFASFDEWCYELEAMVNELPTCHETATREEQKEAMLAWAPHRLRDTCSPCGAERPCAGGPHRLLANVEAVTLLVLDVDACADLEALIAAAKSTSDRGFIYESPSSTPEAPRVRIVAPLSRVLQPEECRASRIAFAHALGLRSDCGVLGAIDAAKLFFAGRMHGTPERRTWKW